VHRRSRGGEDDLRRVKEIIGSERVEATADAGDERGTLARGQRVEPRRSHSEPKVEEALAVMTVVEAFQENVDRIEPSGLERVA
jgi:hypothetical protein